MKTIVTSIEVPEQLDGMTERGLRALRDRLIAAGVRADGIDERLPRVVGALREAEKRRPPRNAKGGQR